MEPSDDSESSTPFRCSICIPNITYKSKSGFWEHNKKYHEDVLANKTRQATMSCGLCDKSFLSQLDICNHVSESHSIKAKVCDIEFNSIKEFELWKAKNEEKKNCVFTRRTAEKRNTTSYFYCHRSGNFNSESKGKRAPRHNQTNRIGFQWHLSNRRFTPKDAFTFRIALITMATIMIPAVCRCPIRSVIK